MVSGQHYYGYCTLSDLIAETYSISIHAGFHPEGIILGGGGEAPGNGCGFIYFSIQLSQILGGKLTPCPPPPLDETLTCHRPVNDRLHTAVSIIIIQSYNM